MFVLLSHPPPAVQVPLLLLYLFPAAIADKAIDMDCTYDTKLGAKYDLSKLQGWTKLKPLTVSDRLQDAEKDYVYTFGICHTVKVPDACKKTNGESKFDASDHFPAFQTNSTQSGLPSEDQDCFYLGSPELNEEDKTKWSLIDDKNPGAGVILTYKDGQHCSHKDAQGNKLRRELSLKFMCSVHGGEMERIRETVMDEASQCKYEITVESEFACPTECGFGGGHSMCNEHGVCGYDTDAKEARCFCNEGFGGAGCDEQKDAPGLAGYGPILGLLIFVTIAIVGLVAAVAALFRFMSKRTVPMDGESYARLGDDGDSFTPMRMDVKGPDGL